MSVVTESYKVDLADPVFVHVECSAVMDTAVGLRTQNASIWFERANLPWVVEALRRSLTTYGLGELARASGNDAITVYESGSERQATFNIDNQRPSDVPHSGTYWIGMSRTLAEKLLSELAAIRATGGTQ